MTVFEAIELALQHQRAGRLAEAESIYRQILAIHPNDENSLHLLGVIASQRGQYQEAADLIGRAIAVNPAVGEYHSNLSLVWMATGRYAEAVESCRRALALKPDSPEIYNNLGNAFRDHGQLEDAIAAYQTALRLRPQFPGAYNNLGIALRNQGRIDEAIAACRTALQLDPNSPEAYNNLGTALEAKLDMEGALAAYQAALRLRPSLAGTHNNLGNVFVALGRLDEAIAAFTEALKLAPTDEQARFNCSLALLLRGDFETGWSYYESRWTAQHLSKKDFFQPMWDGSALNGKRILIHAEQGFGDSIQFIRYARLAAEKGGTVIVECPANLRELFTGVPGVAEVVTVGDQLPPFDVHLPMLSLPLAFRTTRGNIPQEVPYLFADSVRRGAWAQRLGANRARPRIGVAWAGNPENRRSRMRNIRLQDFLPSLRNDRFDFYSLQLGDGAEQIRQLPGDVQVVDFTEHIKNFADTAAFLAELDLVISADTAVVHLAGAMARPVWTLLPFAPDWRWGLAREDTPWYPTMRLFRQPAIGDWGSVIQRVVGELSRWEPNQTSSGGK
jgi:tetratricopeptide (TPR) repeat protein